ncbi:MULTISPECIES: restriction endonuclease subunit S [unclassified Gilliamella]|uniref:restriction endonuclease subunit S n=1 Tax=unclassified Gilliamella TaxID=2685620 RepID=UPI0009BDA85D|nr:restriction endonuclease subunit S [Gilliamella apicola]
MGSLQFTKATKQRRGKAGKVDSSLSKKLQEVKWGEFKLGDLFDIKNTLSFNKEKLNVGNQYDYVTRTSQNQGILMETGYINKENLNSSGNWSLGLLQMDFFYRQKPWYAGQFVRKIVPKIQLKKNSVLYFTALLNKQKQNLLSVLVRDVDKTFLNTIVQLPILKDGQINFDFMENFIAELEAERIAELEAYLSVTGLKDYTLTKEEQQALDDFESDQFSFSQFRTGYLFYINSYKKRFDANKVYISDFGKPYVVRTNLCNGIRGYINEDEQFLNEANTLSFGQDTATIFYQKEPYFTGDKIKILKSKDDRFNKLNGLFFVSTMQKSFSCFSWGRSSFNTNIIEKQFIKLPIKNGQPNYSIMETFISAIQKLVIKDVVLYANKKIAATKMVVQSENNKN